MIVIKVMPRRGDLSRLRRTPERFLRAAQTAMTWAEETARQIAMDEGFSGRPNLISHNGVRGLQGSIFQKVERYGSRILGWLASNLVYARIQELGGTIKAKRAEYLKFRVGGRWVQVKEVEIPARPYISPAQARVMDMLDEFLGKALKLEGLA